jgi:hypothetical protein
VFDEDFHGYKDEKLLKYNKFVPIFFTSQPENYKFMLDRNIKSAKELQTIGFVEGAIDNIMTIISQVEAVRPPPSVDLDTYVYGRDQIGCCLQSAVSTMIWRKFALS